MKLSRRGFLRNLGMAAIAVVARTRPAAVEEIQPAEFDDEDLAVMTLAHELDLVDGGGEDAELALLTEWYEMTEEEQDLAISLAELESVELSDELVADIGLPSRLGLFMSMWTYSTFCLPSQEAVTERRDALTGVISARTFHDTGVTLYYDGQGSLISSWSQEEGPTRYDA